VVIGFFQRWGDARYERAMKRRRTEEIMGWVCVPIFVVVGYFGWTAFQQVQSERTQHAREQVVTPAATSVIRK
jgi:predicted negative regulator of RcsB-dependent stress response